MDAQWERLDLTDSTVKCSFWRYKPQWLTSYRKILVVRFEGEYRDGSSANPDSRFMAAMIRAAGARWGACAMIVDMKELHYEWGDELDRVFSECHHISDVMFMPYVIVGGQKCLPAINTLFFGLDTKKKVIDECDEFFDDLDRAEKWLKMKLAK